MPYSARARPIRRLVPMKPFCAPEALEVGAMMPSSSNRNSPSSLAMRVIRPLLPSRTSRDDTPITVSQTSFRYCWRRSRRNRTRRSHCLDVARSLRASAAFTSISDTRRCAAPALAVQWVTVVAA
ncbi:hypothetical protein D3C86_1870560 [compost metagenome]